MCDLQQTNRFGLVIIWIMIHEFSAEFLALCEMEQCRSNEVVHHNVSGICHSL